MASEKPFIQTQPDDSRASKSVVSERWEFRIGAPVYTTDDTLGALRQVVIAPGEGRVTGLIVRTDTLLPRDLILPLEAVQRASDAGIQLSWNAREARERGWYDELAFHVPARTLMGYASGEAVVSLRGGEEGEPSESGTSPRGLPPIRVGLRVEALDGPAGRVREVLVDSATGRVTHLVMQHGVLWKHDRLVPVAWVRSVTADVVTVEATLADLIRLPEYHPDEELQADILHEWWEDRMLRAMLAHTYLDARVRDGVAILEGYAWSRMHRHRLEELARCVPGVLAVRNQVVTDEELPHAVMAALLEDPRTRSARVRVDSYLGNIRIEGDVPDPETRAALAEVAARVARVKCVINRVRVAGEAAPPLVPGCGLQPRVGQRVLTHDGPFGQVNQVILSPRTRLLTGLVVEGELPVLEASGEAQWRNQWPDQWPRRQRSVVIPSTWIEAVSAEEVLLSVRMREAATAREFQPADYTTPEPSWVPPFPYEDGEVLIDLHRLTRPVSEFHAEPSAPVAVPASRKSDERGRPERGRPERGRPERGGVEVRWPVLARGDRVRCHFGPIGTIDHLLIDPGSYLAAYLVVRGGQGLSKDTLVPVDWIRSVDEDGVLLEATSDQLRLLPQFVVPESDEQLAVAVAQALMRLTPRYPEIPTVLVQVERGAVRLRGCVGSEAERRAAVAAAREVPGVWEVRDEVVTKAFLERQTAAALAEQPETRGSGWLPDVTPEHGCLRSPSA